VPPATYPIDHTLDMCVSNDNAEPPTAAEPNDGDRGTEGNCAA
jgi:hypothetical protein